jgi:Zn-dependent protease
MSIDVVLRVIIWAVPVLFSVILHEVSHGWVAYKLGDDTAKRMGRLTLNPIPHIDILGTVILPLIMIIAGGPVFGWAKPVPYNPHNFDRHINPKDGAMWVALAGPVLNLILAFISSFILVLTAKWFSGLPSVFYYSLIQLFKALVIINIVLACFNLIPIPPLDGSKVLMRFLPSKYESYYVMMERYGFLVIIILLATGAFSTLIWVPVNFLYNYFTVIPTTLFNLL